MIIEKQQPVATVCMYQWQRHSSTAKVHTIKKTRNTMDGAMHAAADRGDVRIVSYRIAPYRIASYRIVSYRIAPVRRGSP